MLLKNCYWFAAMVDASLRLVAGSPLMGLDEGGGSDSDSSWAGLLHAQMTLIALASTMQSHFWMVRMR